MTLLSLFFSFYGTRPSPFIRIVPRLLILQIFRFTKIKFITPRILADKLLGIFKRCREYLLVLGLTKNK